MDVEFVLTYLVIPFIVGTGIISGKLTANHLMTGEMLCFKAIVYAYYAIINIMNFINDAWAVRYLAGLTIALAIMECFAGVADAVVEFRLHYKNK